MFLLAAGMIIYVENLKESKKQNKTGQKTLLEPISEFNKITGYKINMKKSAALVYTCTYNEHDSKNTIPFTA